MKTDFCYSDHQSSLKRDRAGKSLPSPPPRILTSTLVKNTTRVETSLYTFKNYLNFLRCIRHCLTLFPLAIGTDRYEFF